MKFIADILLLSGLASITYAASLIHPALAWLCLGLSLVGVSAGCTTSARLAEIKKDRRRDR